MLRHLYIFSIDKRVKERTKLIKLDMLKNKWNSHDCLLTLPVSRTF